MKKLLTVLCVAAFGIGATAQAQVQVADGAKRTEAKDLKAKITDMSDFSVFGQEGQLQAEAARYDTLGWHDEYITPDCDNYYSIVEYTTDLYSNDVVFSPMGATWSGTGEVGTTFQTEDNLYQTYAKLNLNNSWVVGAVAYVYRRGNPMAWERVGIDRFDPDHMSDVNGVTVPDMPCRLTGYPGDKIEVQSAYADYYEMLWGNGNEAEIDMEMPVTMQGRVQTPTTYVRYLPSSGTSTSGTAWPGVHRIGGMFDHVFPARFNFGLSIQAELTDNQRYDSLWNWAVAAKSNHSCSFIDEWAAWIRLNCYNVDSGWIWLKLNSGAPMDVSLPYNSEDSVAWGLAPDHYPQYGNDHSLYIYAFSMNMGLEEGVHFLPMIYPIVQDRTSNENQDAYAQTVSVYPLPATDKVNVVALDEIQKVEIYNMAGTLIKAIAMNDVHLELDVTSFAPGSYIAKITTANGVASKKLVIK